MSTGYVEPETLLKRVIAGLNSISFEPGKRTPLVMGFRMRSSATRQARKRKIRLAKSAPTKRKRRSGLEGLLPDPSPAIETDDEDMRKNWSRALDRARRISVGEWLAMTDDKAGR